MQEIEGSGKMKIPKDNIFHLKNQKGFWEAVFLCAWIERLRTTDIRTKDAKVKYIRVLKEASKRAKEFPK